MNDRWDKILVRKFFRTTDFEFLLLALGGLLIWRDFSSLARIKCYFSKKKGPVAGLEPTIVWLREILHQLSHGVPEAELYILAIDFKFEKNNVF